ncbi:DUF6454 family protein [Aurantimonas endophytica]|uniref:Uncharacterized protein n=1 Tax=Aurantimonas endophytica TaxID=1522175 RepID=A0A7W6HDF8_9HYPH|nr:DUF6454 family protein [Aurantimonas endophytica]MBB4003037.1 hypothetical protein [Aurantimonas endophytica]
MQRILTRAALVATVCALSLTPSLAADGTVGDRILQLTRGTKWQKTDEIKLPFPTFHPQGMVRIGDEFFVSSVEIIKPTTRYETPRGGYDRDEGEGRGHLFRIDADGRLLGSLRLGEGSIYHPGGIDFDGRHIWVPVAEYRPDGRSIIYRVDPKSMKAEEVLRFGDHVGGLVYDTDADTLHGVSWGSRRFYAWPLKDDGTVANAAADPASLRVANPAQYIDYQDCKYVSAGRMACSGLNAYRVAPDATPFRLGGLEVVDLKDNRPIWQVPIELWAPSGLPMTQNPTFLEATPTGLRGYFMPDDDQSTIFIYEAATQ